VDMSAVLLFLLVSSIFHTAPAFSNNRNHALTQPQLSRKFAEPPGLRNDDDDSVLLRLIAAEEGLVAIERRLAQFEADNLALKELVAERSGAGAPTGPFRTVRSLFSWSYWRRGQRSSGDTDNGGGDANVDVVPAVDAAQQAEAPPIGRDPSIPAVLREDEVCLIPGETMVRVEDAPGNARRIFCAIDVFAPVSVVWAILTDYERLQEVVPSLVSNQVVERRADGVVLKQVGSAELLPGLRFQAKCTLNVVEHPHGIPQSMLHDEISGADSDGNGVGAPLVRGVFPRPYAISQLPHKDLSMQSVETALPDEGKKRKLGSNLFSSFGKDASDFSLYQGVWRIQPLPGCAPPRRQTTKRQRKPGNDGSDDDDGGDGDDVLQVGASRLSYAVELRPTLPVPVALLEGRISSDLVANLRAIRLHAQARFEREEEEEEEAERARLTIDGQRQEPTPIFS